MTKQNNQQIPKIPAVPNSPVSDVLTPAEAAQAKGVTRSAVYKAIAQKRLPHHKILGRVALYTRDVEAWTPARYAGRPAGTPMSLQAKTNIAAGQKRQWAEKKRMAGKVQDQPLNPPKSVSRKSSASVE